MASQKRVTEREREREPENEAVARFKVVLCKAIMAVIDEQFFNHAEAAEFLGIGPSALSEIANYARRLPRRYSIDRMIRVADALDLEVMPIIKTKDQT